MVEYNDLLIGQFTTPTVGKFTTEERELKISVDAFFGEVIDDVSVDRLNMLAERYKELVAERDGVETPFLKQVADQIQFYRDSIQLCLYRSIRATNSVTG